MQLKIGNYNICHCGDYTNRKDTDPVWVQEININAMADAIKKLDFDIIGLNEVYFTGQTEDGFDQAKKLAELAGYPYYANAEGAKEGVTTIGNAILSKYPIVKTQNVYVPTIPVEQRDEDGWYEERVLLVADIEINGTVKKIITTHFGCIKKERQIIVDKICKIFDNEDLFVVMGDFNAYPHAQELQPLYDRMTCASDFVGNTDFTFASYDPTCVIDYIFVKNGVKINDYEVCKIKASDHFPVVAILEI